MAAALESRTGDMPPRKGEMHSRTGEMSSRILDSPRNIDSETNAGASDKQSPVSDHVNLYIRNVAPEATDRELEDAFSRYGAVISCSVVRDPYTKECRGFAFVKVSSEEVADAAMNADDELSVCGRRLGVERARRNGPHDKTPGQYLGIDRTVRDRYVGHKRHIDEGSREPASKAGRYDSYDDRRPRGGDFSRDRWDHVAHGGAEPYEYHERYTARRRFSPLRRAPGSPSRPGRGGEVYRGLDPDELQVQDRSKGFERGYDREYNQDRGRERSYVGSQGAHTRRNEIEKSAHIQLEARRDDFGRDRR
jgi:RNA recognition motif-containing protein